MLPASSDSRNRRLGSNRTYNLDRQLRVEENEYRNFNPYFSWFMCIGVRSVVSWSINGKKGKEIWISRRSVISGLRSAR